MPMPRIVWMEKILEFIEGVAELIMILELQESRGFRFRLAMCRSFKNSIMNKALCFL